MKYDFKTVEAKWQKVWEDEDTFHAEIDHSKPKFYALVEFPYPSAAGHTSAIRAATPRWTSSRAKSVSAAITSCTPWAGTPSACLPRTTP